jgi:hypothetical protein
MSDLTNTMNQERIAALVPANQMASTQMPQWDRFVCVWGWRYCAEMLDRARAALDLDR